MTDRTLAARRVVVVGASAGIGRAFAAGAIAEGASVVVAARRAERLAELIAASGGGSAVECDVRDVASCGRLVHAVADELGEIDLLVISVGLAPLTLLEHATSEQWQNTFDTNVFGVNRVVQTLLEVLAPGAIVAVLSSETVGKGDPRWGIYTASKAAVDELLEAWRSERPDVRFTRIVVGSTIDTEFGVSFPGELLGWALSDWKARGLLPENYLLSETVAEAMTATLAAALALPSLSVDSLTLRPASRPEGTQPPAALSMESSP